MESGVTEETNDQGADSDQDDTDDEGKFPRDPIECLTAEDDGGRGEAELSEDVQDGEDGATNITD